MPTNEQIIEAARRRMSQGDVLHIKVDLLENFSTYKYTVVFTDRGHWTVTPDEVEAVAQEPEQEHRHESCSVCLDMREKSFEAGKASLTRLDRDAVYALVGDMWGCTFQELANAIADNFAAPERKPITEGKAWSLVRSMISNADRHENEGIEQWYARLDVIASNIVTCLQSAPERKPYGPNPGLLGKWIRDFGFEWAELALHLSVKTQELLDDSYPMQPAPEEAEARCPYCDHKDGATEFEHMREQGLLMCAWGVCECAHEFHRERVTV